MQFQNIGVNVFIRMNLRLNLNSFQHNNLQFALDHKRLMDIDTAKLWPLVEMHVFCIMQKGTT